MSTNIMATITADQIAKGAFLAALAVTAITALCVLAVALWEEVCDIEDPIGGIGDEGESEPDADKGAYFTPPQVLDEVAKAHPIDPACGTGAFLKGEGKEAN